jgi:hypothetical protein
LIESRLDRVSPHRVKTNAIDTLVWKIGNTHWCPKQGFEIVSLGQHKEVAMHGQALNSLYNAGFWLLLAGFGSWTASVRPPDQPVFKI